jgi:CheY-like chemotaxis protein
MAGRLILVVDADRDTREAFVEWLEWGGDVVVAADSAASAEAGLAGRVPTVCIFDLQLGGGTGLDVFRYLRAHVPGFHDTLSVVVSGMNPQTVDQLIEAAEMSGVIVLTKPVDPHVLDGVIDRALAGQNVSRAVGQTARE